MNAWKAYHVHISVYSAHMLDVGKTAMHWPTLRVRAMFLALTHKLAIFTVSDVEIMSEIKD